MTKEAWKQKIDLMFKDDAPRGRRQLKLRMEYKKSLNRLAEIAATTEDEYLERLTETLTAEVEHKTANPTRQERATQELMNETTARELVESELMQMMLSREENL